MKKFYLMLLGAMFVTAASAQKGNGGMVCDSTYTTTTDGTRLSKTVNEYNEKDLLTVSYDYTYAGSEEAYLNTRTFYSYDEQNRLVKEEGYNYSYGEYVLASVAEYSEWQEGSNYPGVAIVSELDEENPEAGLQPTTKSVVTKYHDNGAAETIDAYLWNGETWGKMGTMTSEFDAAGRTIKETSTIVYEGMTMETITTYIYDDHGNVKNETTDTKLMGQLYDSSFINYDYDYDSVGNIVKSTQATQTTSSITYYFWSTGIAGIHAATLAKSLKEHSYDLRGRLYNGKPQGKGIFIVEGKKVLVK